MESHPAKVLAVDTDGLNAEHVADGITHYGGQIEFVNGIPGAPVPLPVFGAGAYRSPLLEPGCSCFQHAWVIAEPRFWQLGDPPLHMNVIRGHLAQRDLLEMGAPLVGLAHLWLRHLPVSFVYRMACLNMEWRDARDALLDRRGGLDVLLDALAAGGEEALAAARLEILPHLDSGSPPLSDLWDMEEDRDDRPGHVGGGADAAARCCAWAQLARDHDGPCAGGRGGRVVSTRACGDTGGERYSPRDKRCLLGRFD